MKEELVRVQLQGVAMPSMETGPLAILREIDSIRQIQISIGAFEAGAIITFLEGLKTTRPLTHSLLAGIMREQQLKIDSIEIHSSSSQHPDNFFARMRYRKGHKSWTRDIRASDALALAVETGTALYVENSLLDRHMCPEYGGEPRWRPIGRQRYNVVTHTIENI